MRIEELVALAHQNADEHGFWEDIKSITNYHCVVDILPALGAEIIDKEYTQSMNNAIGNRLMLITGEVAEAHEALRKVDIPNLKEELADIVIRVGDLAGGLGIDLEDEILKKMVKNKNRPYKHGKEF